MYQALYEPLYIVSHVILTVAVKVDIITSVLERFCSHAASELRLKTTFS